MFYHDLYARCIRNGRRIDCTSEESVDNLSQLDQYDDSEWNTCWLSTIGTDNPGRVGTESHSPAQSVERSFYKSQSVRRRSLKMAAVPVPTRREGHLT